MRSLPSARGIFFSGTPKHAPNVYLDPGRAALSSALFSFALTSFTACRNTMSAILGAWPLGGASTTLAGRVEPRFPPAPGRIEVEFAGRLFLAALPTRPKVRVHALYFSARSPWRQPTGGAAPAGTLRDDQRAGDHQHPARIVFLLDLFGQQPHGRRHFLQLVRCEGHQLGHRGDCVGGRGAGEFAPVVLVVVLDRIGFAIDLAPEDILVLLVCRPRSRSCQSCRHSVLFGPVPCGRNSTGMCFSPAIPLLCALGAIQLVEIVEHLANMRRRRFACTARFLDRLLSLDHRRHLQCARRVPSDIVEPAVPDGGVHRSVIVGKVSNCRRRRSLAYWPLRAMTRNVGGAAAAASAGALLKLLLMFLASPSRSSCCVQPARRSSGQGMAIYRLSHWCDREGVIRVLTVALARLKQVILFRFRRHGRAGATVCRAGATVVWILSPGHGRAGATVASSHPLTST